MALKLLDKKYYIDESFTIRRIKNGGYMNEKVHTHDFVELIYVYDGKSCHKVDGIEYSLGRGDLLFVNYGSRHSFETDGNLEYVNIILKPDFISRSLRGEKMFSPFLHCQASMNFPIRLTVLSSLCIFQRMKEFVLKL